MAYWNLFIHTYKLYVQWPAVRTNLSEIKTEVHDECSVFKSVSSMWSLILFLKSPQSENEIVFYLWKASSWCIKKKGFFCPNYLRNSGESKSVYCLEPILLYCGSMLNTEMIVIVFKFSPWFL